MTVCECDYPALFNLVVFICLFHRGVKYIYEVMSEI